MFITLLIFVVVLGLLVFVHELGHFVSAKKLGIAVEEFGFGFPPRAIGFQRLERTVSATEKNERIERKWIVILGKKELSTNDGWHGGTIYSLNTLPLGGFVRIKGESGDQATDPDSFMNKKPWKRILVLSAGVLMNFLLAAFLLSVGFMYGMPQEISDQDIQAGRATSVHLMIMEIAPQSPAERSGIRLGDKLLSIDSQQFSTPENAVAYIGEHSGSPLKIAIQRGNEQKLFIVTAEKYASNEKPLIGIGLMRAGIIRYSFIESIGKGIVATINTIIYIIFALVLLIKKIVLGGGVSNELSGPVGVAVLTGRVAKMGLSYLINFTAMLSINLGILNILPFPALDGGRVLFVILEKLKGRPISVRIEQTFHTIGFALLIALVVFITYKDLVTYGAQIIGSLGKIFNL